MKLVQGLLWQVCHAFHMFATYDHDMAIGKRTEWNNHDEASRLRQLEEVVPWPALRASPKLEAELAEVVRHRLRLSRSKQARLPPTLAASAYPNESRLHRRASGRPAVDQESRR